MTVKEIFDNAENGTLTWEQFQAATKDAKFVDLSEGNYVSKAKFDNEITQRDTRINDLTTTISSRDTDLATLQQTLKDAGDIEALKAASGKLEELQKQYDKETKAYQSQLSEQAYKFAVKEFANGIPFSSEAAKRDFIQFMYAKKAGLEDGRIIGAEDYKQMYLKDNADAIVTKSDPKPKFAEGTQPKQPKKLTLTEMMKMANADPTITFDI